MCVFSNDWGTTKWESEPEHTGMANIHQKGINEGFIAWIGLFHTSMVNEVANI